MEGNRKEVKGNGSEDQGGSVKGDGWGRVRGWQNTPLCSHLALSLDLGPLIKIQVNPTCLCTTIHSSSLALAFLPFLFFSFVSLSLSLWCLKKHVYFLNRRRILSLDDITDWHSYFQFDEFFQTFVAFIFLLRVFSAFEIYFQFKRSPSSYLP